MPAGKDRRFLRLQRAPVPLACRDREGPARVAGGRVPVSLPRSTGAWSGRLPAAGEFAAAIHAVLARAFAALAQRLGGLPDHVTGRGLVRHAASASVPTESLARMVQAVEVLYFGGRLGGAEQYQDSLRAL